MGTGGRPANNWDVSLPYPSPLVEPLMSEMTIAVSFDLNMLHSYTDEHLATLWHVAQANPAPHGDFWAGEIVEKLTYEIVGRWLSKVPAEMYHHKAQDNYWEALRRFARYVPPEGVDSQTDPVAWHQGTWVARDGEVAP